MDLYTSRINYSGHITRFDTTVKTGTSIYAPTWDIVMNSKNGVITWEQYTERYYDLMRRRYSGNKAEFMRIFDFDEAVVMCFCKNTALTTRHCHRYLLEDILEKIALANNIEFNRMGEV